MLFYKYDHLHDSEQNIMYMFLRGASKQYAQDARRDRYTNRERGKEMNKSQAVGK